MERILFFRVQNDIESCRQERIIEQQATEADSERAKFASNFFANKGSSPRSGRQTFIFDLAL